MRGPGTTEDGCDVSEAHDGGCGMEKPHRKRHVSEEADARTWNDAMDRNGRRRDPGRRRNLASSTSDVAKADCTENASTHVASSRGLAAAELSTGTKR
mmetsp:Transcript_7131/g.25308  ORF Transcript_7131/g.25308 Transcript_7131/m.25308 type:complete len:98 (-) Transcript_7131:1257-1550(-)